MTTNANTATTATKTTTMTAVEIPCCLCGTMILPNAANQCPSCLAQDINLKERLQAGPGGAPHSTIYQCRQCRRYQRTPTRYEACEPESQELLSICLKHIPALNNHHNSSNELSRIHLVDTGWIWTEPHSMRFKLHLTVRTAVLDVTVQQRVVVELHCQFHMCPECNREFTNRTWHALVQLRQKRGSDSGDAPKKGLTALEMALAKNKEIRKHVLRIDTARNGFDFYFLSLTQAQSFAAFLQRVAPMRVKTSQKLVSENVQNSTANMKHTVTCDMIPLCRDDLILIDKAAKNCRFAGRLALVTKVSSVIHLWDAAPPSLLVSSKNISNSSNNNPHHLNLLHMELSPDSYYKNEKLYTVLQASHRLVRFVVLDVELLSCDYDNNDNNNPSCESSTAADDAHSNSTRGAGEQQKQLYRGPASGVEKYAMAEVILARESDLGVNDETLTCVSHLGHLISSGDVVLGYDLANATNLLGGGGGRDEWDHQKRLNAHVSMPDVVLVKKVTGDGHDNNNKNDQHDNNEERKPTMTKKKARRRRKNEGKRQKELEEGAARMGFLEDEDNNNNNDHYDDDDQVHNDDAGVEAADDMLSNDAEFAEEVAALEREFAAMESENNPDEEITTSGERDNDNTSAEQPEPAS